MRVDRGASRQAANGSSGRPLEPQAEIDEGQLLHPGPRHGLDLQDQRATARARRQDDPRPRLAEVEVQPARLQPGRDGMDFTPTDTRPCQLRPPGEREIASRTAVAEGETRGVAADHKHERLGLERAGWLRGRRVARRGQCRRRQHRPGLEERPTRQGCFHGWMPPSLGPGGDRRRAVTRTGRPSRSGCLWGVTAPAL